MLDVVTIGRSSVDLYGMQIGGRLEDMASFSKYIGGSPTNIAVGTSRLGLKSGLITRVGDEHMGRFIREQLVIEGVDVRGVVTDPDRLTALVLLGIRDQDRFPLIFYRENCADMAICEDDIKPDLIKDTRCVTVTGTHLSHQNTEAAVLKALKLAARNGAKTALDIDYRPNLWGLSGHGDGENRFIASAAVTARLQATLHLFDLIVGTEEEFHIAGGTTDTIMALKNIRQITEAVLVCKRGPMGASVFVDEVANTLDAGISGPGFGVDVFNVLGAGDGFISGLLRGWLADEDWVTSLKYANACGAFAVSRHGCSPAYPSWDEVQYFFDIGSRNKALRTDEKLEQVHWATNRRRTHESLRVFAFDHRVQFEQMTGASPEKIGAFKQLCLKAALQVSDGQPGYGVLVDNRLGRDALFKAAGSELWIGRPVEWPGSRPLSVEPEIGVDFGGLSEWPLDQVVKVLCFYHPDDDEAIKKEQEQVIKRLFAASRRNRLEFLLEVIPSKVGECDEQTTAKVIQRFYDIGVYPDWWKLEPMQSDAGWQASCATVKKNDPWCQGIVLLGLGASSEELGKSLKAAANHPLVKGFAIGRTIFANAAKNWLGGRIDDDSVVRELANNYGALCKIWDTARSQAD